MGVLIHTEFSDEEKLSFLDIVYPVYNANIMFVSVLRCGRILKE